MVNLAKDGQKKKTKYQKKVNPDVTCQQSQKLVMHDNKKLDEQSIYLYEYEGELISTRV